MYRFFMTASARTALWIVGFLLAAFAALYVALFFYLPTAHFRNWVQTELSQRSGYQVQIAGLGVGFPLNVVAEKVEIARPGELFFTAHRLTATVSPFDLLSKTLQRVDVETPVLQLDVQKMMKSSTKTSARIALRRLNIKDGTIVLKKGDAAIFELPKINLAAENLNLGKQSGVHLRADVPSLNGDAELQMTGQPRNLETEIVIRPKQSQSLFARQKPKDALPELLRLRATLHAPENQKADATIEGKFFDIAIGDAKLTGGLNASVEMDSGWTVASFSGGADLTDFPKASHSAAFQLPSGKAAAKFAGVFSLPQKTLSLKSVELSSSIGTGAAEGELTFEPAPRISRAKLTLREIPLDNLKTLFPAPYSQWIYQGRAQVELDVRGALDALEVKGLARSDTMQIRGENVNVANLTVAVPFEWMKPALRIREAKLTATKPAYGAKDRWQSSAERLQMNASLDLKANEPLKISGRIETAGAKFNSPDSSKVGEDLTLRGPFEMLLSPAKNSASIKGKFTAETGELLWGKFFGDLKAQQPALELDGDYSRIQDRLECRRCNFTLAKIGAVDLAGSIERLGQSPALRLQARSANFSPGAFFEFFLRENFKRQYPVLEKLGVGGDMTFQLDLNGGLDALVAEGEVSLKAGELRVDANDWQIAPIALNLPLLIRLSDVGNVSNGSPKTGTLSIGKARFGQQSMGPLSTTVSLSNNALRFHQPIRLNLFGGEIAIANLLWPDVVSDAKRVSFSAEVKRLQLEEMTEALNWHRFTGTLTGSIPQVQSAGNLLRTSGEFQVELFGGRMRIDKLEIENLFSSLASIKLDARLNDIQLEQVSNTFEFGRISGILEGSIEDLVLTDGQPAELRADFHSVDGRGAEQRISVEAINKITVLSSGQSAGALYGGLAGFFDSFRYSKLGFKATLKNDRLSLRGVETRGDQEFLVVGSFLPPTVNIISHTQNIAFSELLRRLERIKSEKPNVK